MSKSFSAVLLSAALATSTAALAQTTPQPTQTPEKVAPPSTTPPTDGSATQPQWYKSQANEMRASDLIGSSVRNAGGDRIGEINEVIIGRDGKVMAVVVGVGGFLGIGERQVAVNFESLQIGRESNGSPSVTMQATKESLQAAPQWRWRADGDAGTTSPKPSR